MEFFNLFCIIILATQSVIFATSLRNLREDLKLVARNPAKARRKFKQNDFKKTNTEPVLTFEGKRYSINSLPEDVKELVKGMQVADRQLRMYEDTLKIIAVGRQTLAMQLNNKLKDKGKDMLLINFFLNLFNIII